MCFTVDTGAGKTNISKETYHKIASEQRPALSKTTPLRGAAGKPIAELGEAVFTMQLGSLTLQKKIIVAEIEDDGLLGSDILQQDRHGPADILLSQGVIKLRGHLIPCLQVGLENRIRKVHAADDFTIPGFTEAVIDVLVETFEGDEFKTTSTEVLIEPTKEFTEKYPLIVAASLVDWRANPTTKIRIMNPFSQEVTIKQNTQIASAESCDGEPEVLVDTENRDEEDNNSYIRRIQTIDQTLHETPLIKDPVKLNLNADKTNDMPTYLQEMYEEAIVDKNAEEQRVIAELLINYQDRALV